jgi:HD-like signal output (HDOD) protein
LDAWKFRWGVGQWAAFFENQKLPVMLRSRQMMTALEEERGELLSPKELSDIVLGDPLLCVCLLRQAEREKSHRLDNETTTALAAIMQLGVDEFRSLLLSSPEIEEGNDCLREVEARATLAAQIALRWAAGRMDLNPEEIAVAALLVDIGELLICAFQPELARAAQEELISGRAHRSSQAQMQTCGFDFKQLTMRCAELWQLPSLVVQLLRGAESTRAQLTRIASNTARHILDGSATAILAITADLAEAHKLMPAVSLEWLIEELVMLPEDVRAELLARSCVTSGTESNKTAN